MQFNNVVVVGNTIDIEKYAYKIKHALIEQGYQVASVGKELESINDVDFEIDVLDLCINPHLGIKLLRENRKQIKVVVIQPGASSDEIVNYLKEKEISFIDGCMLLGLKLYPR